MTTEMRYPTAALTLGADGFAPVNPDFDPESCCPDPICSLTCDDGCSTLSVLPTGPLWDKQKAKVQELIAEGDCDSVIESDCPSMALYAAYADRTLRHLISNALWPSLRESSPHTAVTTLDDWLLRYAWQDCYRQHCRRVLLTDLSPYEYLNDCGDPEYCETSFPDAFECALKHAILVSLDRARRGVIKNLDGLNWIIAPLGAELRPLEPYPEDVQAYIDGDCPELEADDEVPCFCGEANFELCPTSEELAGCPPLVCGDPVVNVAAEQVYSCEGQEDKELYPAVIAAECIIRSLLPRACPNIIYRCGEAPDALEALQFQFLDAGIANFIFAPLDGPIQLFQRNGGIVRVDIPDNALVERDGGIITVIDEEID